MLLLEGILSSKMDPAENKLIRLVVIKENVAEGFKQNPPVPHPLRAL
jgi:hypothetical protein